MKRLRSKSCAVLVLNANGKQFLKACFQSLQRQTQACDVFLLDNASTDGSVQYTKRFFPEVTIFSYDQNHYFVGAYNEASKRLQKVKKKYEYILILNNDTISAPNMISELMATLEHDPSLGIVQPTILFGDGTVSSNGNLFVLPSGTPYAYRYQQQPVLENTLVTSNWVSGCCMFLSFNLFKKLGGFPPYTIYYEDIDLSWGTIVSGRMVGSVSSTTVTHFGGGAKVQNSLQTYLGERNRIWLYYRHFPLWLFVLLSPVLWAFRLLVTLYHLALDPTSLQTRLQTAGSAVRGWVDGILGLPKIASRNVSLQDSLRLIATMVQAQHRPLPV